MKRDERRRPTLTVLCRLGTIALAFIILLGACGCMGGEQMFNQMERWNLDIKQQMLEYMETKYGEKFKLVNPATDNMVFPEQSFETLLYPENDQGWDKTQAITVAYNAQAAQGEQPFSDNYVAFLLNSQVAPLFAPYVEQVYGADGILFAYAPSAALMPDSFNRSTTVEEFVLQNGQGATLALFVTKDLASRDADAQKLWDLLAQTPYEYSLRYFYISPETMDGFTGTTKDEYTKLPRLCTAVMRCFGDQKEGGFQPLDWRGDAA